MELTKTFNVVLNLSPKEMYSGDLDSETGIIFEKLKSSYEGKCYGNSFIKKVDSIENRSKIQIIKSDLTGASKVSVRFKTTTIQYPNDQIIFGAKVIKRGMNNMVVCETDHAYIYINLKNQKIVIKPGDLLLLKVIECGYPFGEEKAVINGKLFIQPKEIVLFLVKVNNLDQETIKQQVKKTKLVKKQFEDLKKSKPKQVKFFTDLLFPYKKTITKPKQLNNYNILDYTEQVLAGKSKYTNNDGFIIIKNNQYPKENGDIFIDNNKAIKDLKDQQHDFVNEKRVSFYFQPEKYQTVLLKLLYEYQQHLEVIIKFTQMFSDEKTKQDHDYIWKFYENYKNTG